MKQRNATQRNTTQRNAVPPLQSCTSLLPSHVSQPNCKGPTTHQSPPASQRARWAQGTGEQGGPQRPQARQQGGAAAEEAPRYAVLQRTWGLLQRSSGVAPPGSSASCSGSAPPPQGACSGNPLSVTTHVTVIVLLPRFCSAAVRSLFRQPPLNN